MEATLSVFTFAYLGAIRMDNNVTGKLSWCQFAHVTELTIRRTKNIMAELSIISISDAHYLV